MKDLIQKTANVLKTAKVITFFTGAGISAESGIPTFRGDDGIWKKLKAEELASFDAFMRNPDLVWEWYSYRRQIINKCIPNSAHKAIVEAEKLFSKVHVITQNVDGLHIRAGSSNVYELHGNIERNYCIKCKTFYNDVSDSVKVPKCTCGGLIRPDIVWFGEMLPEKELEASEKAVYDSDVVFVIGTSAVVYPAANYIYMAKRLGKYLIEINVEQTSVSNLMDKVFTEKSGVILPQIMKSLQR